MNVDCKKLKIEGLEKLLQETKDKTPKLVIIQVEGDSASDIYVRNKRKACENVGIELNHILLKQQITTEEIIEIIEKLNQNQDINGIMVQLPLPKHLNENQIINTISPIKDVDGLTNENLGRIVSKEKGLRPCTAEGIITILKESIGLNNLKGKKITIIGRTKLVGLPLFHMLLEHNATPTICHTSTNNLEEYTKTADIIITAAGSETPFINADMIKENSIIIDVSTVRDKNGKLHGDVIYDQTISKAAYITPVPGGVGQLTVLELMKNVIKAYEMQKQQEKHQKKTKIKKLKHL